MSIILDIQREATKRKAKHSSLLYNEEDTTYRRFFSGAGMVILPIQVFTVTATGIPG